jgi:hypothetical protein
MFAVSTGVPAFAIALLLVGGGGVVVVVGPGTSITTGPTGVANPTLMPLDGADDAAHDELPLTETPVQPPPTPVDTPTLVPPRLAPSSS